MLSARPPRYRIRSSPRITRSLQIGREPLGCVIVRRITDDAGRAWRVREFRSHRGLGLFVSCEIPGIRAETRAAFASLESLDEERLVELLQNASE